MLANNIGVIFCWKCAISRYYDIWCVFGGLAKIDAGCWRRRELAPAPPPLYFPATPRYSPVGFLYIFFYIFCKYLSLLYFWLCLCLVWFWSGISILPLEVEWFIIPKVDRPFQLDSPELNLFMEPRTGKWNKFHLLDKSRFHTSKNYHWLQK